jgi:3-hydroxyisobutyrate dehydrogenase
LYDDVIKVDISIVLFLLSRHMNFGCSLGTGEVAKLCNNLSLAVSMVGTAEAFALGAKLGIDPKVLAGVINTSTGRCWSSDSYNPCPGVMEGVPASRDFEGGFATALMEKDLFLAQQAARSVETPLPLAAQAHALYSVLKANGHGHLDFGSVYLLLTGQLKAK